MHFELQAIDRGTSARAGRMALPHGGVETPVFMPVGTNGTVKGVLPRALTMDIDAPIILANTYHLYLRPGTDLVQHAGGLHTFMSWDRPMLTDSGGYQVFSLANMRTLTEDGVRFRSHLDGSEHLFTPERVIDIQRQIGADIMMVLDECPPGDADQSYAATSNDLTLRWAKRCKDRFESTNALYGYEQALFAIVQGVVYADVRRDSAQRLVDMDFPGYAIGGLSVGEPAEQMYAMVEVVEPFLPAEKPRYLMGVGTPANLLESIARGMDMFDCVMPTRNARNGMIFTTEGILNIRNEKWREDFDPIDAGLKAYASTEFSRAYLRHLFLAKEMLGAQIATLQNLALYEWLMREARAAILEGRYAEWYPPVAHRLDRRL